jgi:hypothetical protein
MSSPPTAVWTLFKAVLPAEKQEKAPREFSLGALLSQLSIFVSLCSLTVSTLNFSGQSRIPFVFRL